MKDTTKSQEQKSQQAKCPLEMPERYVHLAFFIDTNRINAREGLPYMNQLEEWHRNELISIEMPQEAHQEAIAGGSPERTEKAKRYIRSIATDRTQAKYRHILERIEKILFPAGVQTPNQRCDVRIVFNTGYYRAILITDDGDSQSQPNGILGNRSKLAELGIQVMRDSEAVELVKDKIQERDSLARAIAEKTGKVIPGWVGTD